MAGHRRSVGRLLSLSWVTAQTLLVLASGCSNPDLEPTAARGAIVLYLNDPNGFCKDTRSRPCSKIAIESISSPDQVGHPRNIGFVGRITYTSIGETCWTDAEFNFRRTGETGWSFWYATGDSGGCGTLDRRGPWRTPDGFERPVVGHVKPQQQPK